MLRLGPAHLLHPDDRRGHSAIRCFVGSLETLDSLESRALDLAGPLTNSMCFLFLRVVGLYCYLLGSLVELRVLVHECWHFVYLRLQSLRSDLELGGYAGLPWHLRVEHVQGLSLPSFLRDYTKDNGDLLVG